MNMFYIVNFVEARAIHSLNSESDFSHLSAKDITLPFSSVLVKNQERTWIMF